MTLALRARWGASSARVSGAGSRGMLVASAAFLGLLLAAALFLPAGRAEASGAMASALPMDLTTQGPDHAALTLEIGSGEDMLVLLDQRSESLLMYRVRNQSALEFRGRQDLRELFGEARRAAGQ